MDTNNYGVLMKKILLLSLILFPVFSHAFSSANSTAFVGYQTQLSTGDFLVISSGWGPKMAQEALADTQDYLENGNLSILLDTLIKQKQSNDSSLSREEALDLVIEDAKNITSK